MIWFIIGSTVGTVIGYLVKHFSDNYYLKKLEECWLEDARELDRLIAENKRLTAILNKPISRKTQEPCKYSNEELIDMFHDLKVTVPDDPKIDFGGFEL